MRPDWSWKGFFLLAVWGLACAGSALAEDQFVLGAANGSGRLTRLSITNRNGSTVQATLRFLAAGGTGSAPSTTASIAPGATMVWANAVSDLWGLTDQQGIIEVSSSQALILTASKYISSGDGRIGSALPVTSGDDLRETGAVGDLLWVPQAADAASGLSSTIEVCLADAGSQVELAIVDAAGKDLMTQTVTGMPLVRRIAVSSLVQGALGVARAEVRAKAGHATAAVEVSDGATGHRTTSLIQRNLDQDQDWTVDAAFYKTQKENSLLRTDVRILSPNRTATTVTA